MQNSQWSSHKKHFLVFTSAGKPIWTRYGEESDLSTFTASLVAIIHKFAQYYNNQNDMLKCIRTHDTQVVFMVTEALYYCCITRKPEHTSSILKQLRALHSKVISTLTGSIEQMLVNRPNYDARGLMGGTQAGLNGIVKSYEQSPCFLSGFMPARLPTQVRNNVGSVFKSFMNQEVLYGFVLTTSTVLYKYCRKGATLHPNDVILLTNLLHAYTSLRSTMSWTPICLPNYSDRGFLYAYITFLRDSSIGIVLVSDDSSAFNQLKQCGDGIEERLQQYVQTLETTVASTPYSVGQCELKEVRHFVYVPKANDQYTMPSINPASRSYLPELPKNQWKELLFRYFSAYEPSLALENQKNLNYFRIDVYRNEQILCMRQANFTLLVAMSPLLNSSQVEGVANALLKWLRREENSLFILKQRKIWEFLTRCMRRLRSQKHSKQRNGSVRGKSGRKCKARGERYGKRNVQSGKRKKNA